jgi:hypothetical protein
VAIGHVALAEGPERLPAATIDAQAHEIKLRHDDHAICLTALPRPASAALHDLWPELELPAGCLDREKSVTKLNRASVWRRAGGEDGDLPRARGRD